MEEAVSTTIELCKSAKAALGELSRLTPEKTNEALLAMADSLVKNTESILLSNREDCERARESISPVMLDRLKLDEGRILAMASGIREIAALPSPLGTVLDERVRPNGLVIKKVSVPIGVIAIIYESRPNVTSDAAALAIKSGNACILRSGKDAYRSARAIVLAMKEGLRSVGITEDALGLVCDTTRAGANELMRASDYVDLLIPRGGAGLIRSCIENATVPCLQTGTGICHVYVDRAADIGKALSIIENAKTSRPSVCNAAEVLLVHRDIA
ncbi:MAG: glutamate-5-semialdehyde dehydrogenase, partial [Clostridia bacterium]|nr:glutamate-5-semialdehyde dehydrogenase [Clostridia bacterium]